jgi:hypothetical protein
MRLPIEAGVLTLYRLTGPGIDERYLTRADALGSRPWGRDAVWRVDEERYARISTSPVSSNDGVPDPESATPADDHDQVVLEIATEQWRSFVEQNRNRAVSDVVAFDYMLTVAITAYRRGLEAAGAADAGA